MSKKIKDDLYPEKIDWIKKHYIEMQPKEFYRMMFPTHSFQEADESEGDYKSNGIIMYRSKVEDRGKMHTRIIFDDLEEIDNCVNEKDNYKNCEFAIISGCSYIGHRKLNSNARLCYAIIIDVDEVNKQGLSMLLGMGENKIIPMPTAVVVSGNGVHIYYMLEEPIKLYAEQYSALSDLKQLLARMLWNANTSLDPNPQYQGITQGYRVIGTKTKRNHVTRAFLTGYKINIEYLIEAAENFKSMPFLKPKKENTDSKCSSLFSKKANEYLKRNDLFDENLSVLYDGIANKIGLEEAKEKYPDWYERRIVNKEPPKSIIFSDKLYYWWLEKISSTKNVHVGHRWSCMYCLAAYAQKCDIPENQFRNDLATLFPIYQSLSSNKENEFTVNDVQSVIKAFQNTDLTKMTAKRISALSGIKIKRKANKKPRKKQRDHLRECREIRDSNYKNGKHWYDNGGRPSKEKFIREYIKSHPNANVSQIARECGVSRPTVYKYLHNNTFSEKSSPIETESFQNRLPSCTENIVESEFDDGDYWLENDDYYCQNNSIFEDDFDYENDDENPFCIDEDDCLI